MSGLQVGGTVSTDFLSSQAVRQGRLQTGGALVAGGAAAWLAHSVLMIVGLVSVLSFSVTNVQQTIFAATTAMLAFLVATVAVLLASFLLGAGLLAYPGGMGALSWQDSSGAAHVVSPGTRMKARAAGVAVIVYGVQGVLAVVLLLRLMDAGANRELSVALSSLNLLLYNWTIAAIVLIVASSLYLVFAGSLRREIATTESIGGVGLLAYSIVNAIGVVFLTFPLLSLLSDPIGALNAPGLAIMVGLGVLFELLVVPIIGIVVFSLTILHGLRMRKLVGGGVAIGAVGTPLAAPGNPWATPAVTLGPPISQAPIAAFTAGGTPPAGRPIAPSFSAPPGTDDFVLRLEADLDELDRAIREEKALLYDADEGFENGVYDAETHEDLVRKGKERIDGFQREIGRRRAELAERSGRLPPPPDDFENS